MTTKTWDFSLTHLDNAGFRLWGANFSEALADVGLVKTGDTGQINWTTAVKPGQGAFAGYEIWRFPDSSVFIKFEFGTLTTNFDTNFPNVRAAVGTGSNGTGTLTGAVSAARNFFVNTGGAPPQSTESRRSHMVYVNGFFGFWGYRRGSAETNQSLAFFAVARTVNANGAVSSVGATVYWRRGIGANNTSDNATAAVQALNFSTNYVGPVTTLGDYCVVPHGLASSIFYEGEELNPNTQVFVNWTAMPRVFPVMQICSVVSSEVPAASTFQVALVGATARTYLALTWEIFGAGTGGTLFKIAILWE